MADEPTDEPADEPRTEVAITMTELSFDPRSRGHDRRRQPARLHAEDKAGQWDIGCFEPGHYEVDMTGTLTVQQPRPAADPRVDGGAGPARAPIHSLV